MRNSVLLLLLVIGFLLGETLGRIFSPPRRVQGATYLLRQQIGPFRRVQSPNYPYIHLLTDGQIREWLSPLGSRWVIVTKGSQP